jgi:hypothetical protein
MATPSAIEVRQKAVSGCAMGIARRLHRLIVGFFLLSAVPAFPADDWIDELPTVTAVAHAVAQQLKIDTSDWNFDGRGIALKDDDDLFAVYMVGTLVLLRQIILYKYQEESSLTPERETKLRSVVAAYLEAELLVGQGVGMRRGYLTTAQKCRDVDCYRRWFKMGIHNVGGASYRRRILPRLFPCYPERASELDRLAQSYATRAPYMPSPAVTLEMEPDLAGVVPAGCADYGGDGNRNGLCDDWQNPPPAACPAIARDNQPQFSGGTVEAGNRWVEVRTGVSARQGDKCEVKTVKVKDCNGDVRSYPARSGGCEIPNGISIRAKCASGHVVQFISREYWKRGTPDSQIPDHNLESGSYGAAPYTPDAEEGDVSVQTCYEKTADLKNRKWRTDSPMKPNPYYESTRSYATTCDSMTIFDAPNVSAAEARHYLVVRIMGKSFAICDCKVVAVVDWQREYYAASPDQPVYVVKPPREPLLGEVEAFQARSREAGFDPWPPSEEECRKCAP